MIASHRGSFRKGMRVRLRANRNVPASGPGSVAAVAANLVLVYFDDGRTAHLTPDDARCSLEELPHARR